MDSKDRITEFSYKVENDSVIYMKEKGSDSYKEWATVRTYSESYDYLQFIINEKGQKRFFNLNKISE
ncbi:MAG: hypothetical protein WCK02_12905 [Bacteroidota bacterium]